MDIVRTKEKTPRKWRKGLIVKLSKRKKSEGMSGLLFLIVVDWLMRNSLQEGSTGIRWKFTTKLEDLDFADDIALLSSTKKHIQTKIDKLAHETERVGLNVNADRCKLL